MTKRVFVVYVIRNLLDGKSYIGKTSGRSCVSATDTRFKRHIFIAKKGGGYRLHAAIRKHGADNFEVGYLHICQTERGALALEVSEIARRAPAYNLTRGGDGVLGHRWTPEQKARISHPRGPMKPEHVAAMALRMKGRFVTPNQAAKIAVAKMGTKYRQRTKLSMSEIARGTARKAGLKFYLTDKTCKNGHAAPRYVSTRQCCECHRIYYASRNARPQMETIL